LQIVRQIGALPPALKGAVVAIGNFDGVHRGHQAVMAEAASRARAAARPLAVLSFEPHPRSVLRPSPEPFRLTPFRIKASVLAALGVERLYVLRFNTTLAAKSAEAFVADVLVKGVGAHAVVVGDDFAFGQGRAGNLAVLRTLAAQYGFAVYDVRPAGGVGGKFSSSDARTALSDGRLDAVAGILGRWFEIEGRVARGDQRGRQLGFPTANLPLKNILAPPAGVYALFAGMRAQGREIWYPAVANLGSRPTFDGLDNRLEIHLFDYQGDLYGQRLCARFVARLRPERKFDGIATLKEQIARDCREARQMLAALDPARLPAPVAARPQATG
jgi:riboflavin kinase/FMN adenylyltransferase